MRIDKFTKTTINIFEAWFNSLKNNNPKEGLPPKIDQETFFPKNIVIAESPTHYVAELTGEQPFYQPNSIKFRFPIKPIKISNLNSYFNAGFPVKDNEEGIVNVQGGSMACLRFCTHHDKELIKDKFDLSLIGAQILPTPDFNPTIPLNFNKGIDKTLLFEIDTIRADNFRLFYRYISTAIIVRKSNTVINYRNWLMDLIDDFAFKTTPRVLIGLNHYPNISETPFAKKLLSLAYENVKESDIDDFLQNHEYEFSLALGYLSAKSQVNLKIIEKEGWDKNVLIPDYLMLKNNNIHHDILDLKKGLLKYRSLTKNGKSRIRFIDYLDELVAQLDGYKMYFESKENRDWAFKNIGVKVDKPLLIGIVGNHNNFIRENIDLALKKYNRNDILILSYNELFNLIRIKKNPPLQAQDFQS